MQIEVYRRSGERFVENNVAQNLSFGGDSISYEIHTDLTELNLRININCYITNILEEHVLRFVGFIVYNSFVSMYDNGHDHVTRKVLQYNEDIE